MRKLWNMASLTLKQAIASILLVTVSLGVTVVCTSVLLSQHLEETLQERAEETVTNLNQNIGECFREFQELTILPLYDMELQEVLLKYTQKDTTRSVLFSDQRIVYNFFMEQFYDNPYIKASTIYLTDGNYVVSDYNLGKWSETDFPWIETCKNNPYHTFIFTQGQRILFCRALKDALTPEIMAFITVELNHNAVAEILDEYALPENCEVFITNEFGAYLHPTDSHENIDILENEEQYLYSTVTSSDTGLTITVRISTDTINDQLAVLHKQVLCIAIAALFLSWLLAYYLSKTLTQPIISLKRKMELVSEGRLDTRMPVESYDEIGQLESMFNNMMEKLEYLITDFYEVSIASRDAQISALQSQINPHFLYNTLETINMMAVVDGKFEISDAVSNLGKMMHYCVANEQHFATLEEEFRFVTAYYDIQRLRIDKLHSLTIKADEACRGQQVPKLLLQPFVENIVQHGVGDHNLDILLEVSIDGEDLLIHIENNGVPLEPEARLRLEERLRGVERSSTPASEPKGKGYGLVNVHTRLRLLYGNGYGVSLDNGKTDGVRFEIKLKRRANLSNVSGNDC